MRSHASAFFVLFRAVLPKCINGQGIIKFNANDANVLTGQEHPDQFDRSPHGVTVSLNLVGDESTHFTADSGIGATYEKINSSERGWHGRARDISGNANIISTTKDAIETYTGSFVINDKICNLSNVDGSHVVSCKNGSEYPPSLDPHSHDTVLTNILNPEIDDEDRGLKTNSGLINHHTTKSSEKSSSTKSIIDIMVVWTKNSECKRSNQPEGCLVTTTTEDTMRSLVDLAVFETNQAYVDSHIDIELRLVHAYREPTYVEASSDAFNAALSAIRSTFDGIMDDVHDKRTLYGADLVALLIDDEEYCGLANLGPSKGLMFSVTSWSCATGNYSFGHELGHNMGCNHDRGTIDHCDTNQYNAYSYGWRDPEGTFRTIMAYNCETTQCDENPSVFCPKVQMFSNPISQTDKGKSVGNALNDCRQQHNDVRSEVENYYEFISDCNFDSDCNDNNSCTVDSCGFLDKLLCRFENICETTIAKTGTTYYPGNGIFFDVVAKSDVVIKTLHTKLHTNPTTVEVYTKEGTHAGNMNSESLWTRVAQSGSTGERWDTHAIPLQSFSDILIPAFGRQAFYVKVGLFSNLDQLPTLAGTSLSTISVENNHLTIYEGNGATDRFVPSGYFDNWAGSLVYEVPSERPSSIPTIMQSTQHSTIPSHEPSTQLSYLPTTTTLTTSTPTINIVKPADPSKMPSVVPSGVPTIQPSVVSSSMPSTEPSAVPSGMPSNKSSAAPSSLPSSQPSSLSSEQSSGMPSVVPSGVPSIQPSVVPSSLLSTEPSALPSGMPSNNVSAAPSSLPSSQPSRLPSAQSSGMPSSSATSDVPSTAQSGVPSGAPSSVQSGAPSSATSDVPSTAQYVVPS
eukprot:CAMPEP_0194265496 /NCGR_PEP_ID=MMETSP0169-20130528/717_1 /TAXON_ID=218684 /ORGANISM="Corethron pennatum, Strain L29A3" /LENGTH=853 /DNA_ID=CAMNT_0039005969 /DNA_START=87 /DNA_END=2644 /DNA_ORIENTATION=-